MSGPRQKRETLLEMTVILADCNLICSTHWGKRGAHRTWEHCLFVSALYNALKCLWLSQAYAATWWLSRHSHIPLAPAVTALM
jgi:hypothetical protein